MQIIPLSRPDITEKEILAVYEVLLGHNLSLGPKGPAFEQAFAELEEAVRTLEHGDLPLEESLALYERGQELAAYCAKLLDEAELKIAQIEA